MTQDAWAAPQVLDRVCLFLLPSLPFIHTPFPTLLPHPSLHSLPLPSHPGWRVPIPPALPSLSLPSLFPSPGGPTPKPARGSGERYKLPQWGLGRSPSRQTIWCISGPKGPALLATVFVHFIKINVIFCDFEAEGSIKFSLP